MNKKEYNKQYHLKNKERIKERRSEQQKEYRLKNKEKIKKACKEYLLKNKEKIKEYRLKNKEKFKNNNKKYHLENKDYISERKKEYRLKNIDYISKREKEYRLKNKEKVREACRRSCKKRRKRINKYCRDRKRNDPSFRLRCNLKSRIYDSLKRVSKSARTMELISCTIEELWSHLESRFEPGMTRENYGKWHVDHIKPCASFDLTDPEQQRVCFHHLNLQPLWASDNISKGAR